MSDRPTPEQIAGLDFDGQGIPDGFEMIAGHRLQLLASLRVNGYVIVHPDDIPGCDVYRIPGISDRGYPDACLGWMKCRDHIFAAEQETP